MTRYIGKRLLIMIPTVLAIVFIIFLIIHMMPSTPGRVILGIQATEEQVREVNESLGYYDPLPIQFIRYIGNALKGDFGNSYQFNRPAFDILLPKMPATFRLALIAMAVAFVMGVSIGVISALKKYSLSDTLLTVLALFFASVPTFFLGIMMMLLFSLKLGWLPSSGSGDWHYYVMPVISLALPSTAFISRMTRSTMLETASNDYVMTARAKGCGPLRIVFCHELRNAMMPVVTQVGMDFAGLLGGSVIVETVFGMQGIGNVVLNAINTKDGPIIMAAVLVLSVLFMLVMLIVDILYALLDPRVAARSFGGKRK